MSTIKCFSIMEMLVEEATKRFAPIWKLNKYNYSILEDYCGVIDSISEEFDGSCYTIDIDEIDMTIKITVQLVDLTIEDKDHRFYKLAAVAQRIEFSVSEDGNLNLCFVFPSVWEKV